MRLVDDVAARYHRWEAKIAGHLRDWSVRRRSVVLVLLPALLCDFDQVRIVGQRGLKGAR
jgi:hypothetical protein